MIDHPYHHRRWTWKEVVLALISSGAILSILGFFRIWAVDVYRWNEATALVNCEKKGNIALDQRLSKIEDQDMRLLKAIAEAVGARTDDGTP